MLSFLLGSLFYPILHWVSATNFSSSLLYFFSFRCWYTIKKTTHNNSEWQQRHWSILGWTVWTFRANFISTQSLVRLNSHFCANFLTLFLISRQFRRSLCEFVYLQENNSANRSVSRMIDLFQWTNNKMLLA